VPHGHRDLGYTPTSPPVAADAIRFAIQVGGDTDTIAAMTGALAGARCAASALPPTWLHRLEFAERLIAAADQLAGTAEKPGGPAVAR